MQSIENRILSRIRGRGRGVAYVTKDFLDLGSRAAVDKALSRLTEQGQIRRLGRGIYYYPKINPRLGALTLSPDDIASALAKKTNSQLQIAGAHAANALGLSTQVPARIVYLTNGDSKRVQIGNQTIELRHTSPKNMSMAGRISGTVVQALRYIGRNNVNTDVISKLKKVLSDDDKAVLKKDINMAPEWMQPIIVDVISWRNNE